MSTETDQLVDMFAAGGTYPVLDEANALYAVASEALQKRVDDWLVQYPKEGGEHWWIPQSVLERVAHFMRVEGVQTAEEKLSAESERWLTSPSTMRDIPRRVTDLEGCREHGTMYHGSRASEWQLKKGFCVQPAVDFLDMEWWEFPDPEEVPRKFRFEAERISGEIPSPEFTDWLDEHGYQTGYDWPGLWRQPVWGWYRSLSPKNKKIFLSESGLEGVFKGRSYNQEVDVLGAHISLFWASDSQKAAEDYARGGGLYVVDTSQINAWGCLEDEMVDDSIVFFMPTACIQIPGSAFRKIG